MSFVVQPDPHPGRCLNIRASAAWTQKVRRCLRLDEHDGACRFPDPEPLLDNHYWATGTYVLPEPAPWVEPA